MKKSLLYFLGLGLWFWTPNVRAAATEVDVTTPSFSFDAKKIAYSVCTYTNEGGKFNILTSEVWAANSDGSGARRLTTGSMDGDMHWSPDGKRIAFIRKGDIWMVGADGTGLKQITKTNIAEEVSPEFSNDGKTLFFVRTDYINLMEFTPGAKPVLFAQPSVVVAYNLSSGQEKEHLKSKNSVIGVAPNRADANEVFLLYTQYETGGQIGEGDTVVAAAKLDGGGKRVLKTQKKGTRPILRGLYPHSAGLVIETEELDADYESVRCFLVPSKNGDKTFKANALPSMNFSDISLDGRLVSGIGTVRKHIDGELYVESSIKIYDLANDQTVSLDRKTLLGLVMTPVVTPPAPVAAPKINPLPVPATAKVEPPAAAQLYYSKGRRSHRRGDYALGRDEFSKAIEIYPGYVEAYANRAVLHMLDRQYEKALVDLNAVIRLAPNDIHGYIKRGQYHLKVGDQVAARADFDAAIRVNPRSHEAYYERAMFFSLIGDKQKEAEDLKTARELPYEPVR